MYSIQLSTSETIVFPIRKPSSHNSLFPIYTSNYSDHSLELCALAYSIVFLNISNCKYCKHMNRKNYYRHTILLHSHVLRYSVPNITATTSFFESCQNGRRSTSVHSHEVTDSNSRFSGIDSAGRSRESDAETFDPGGTYNCRRKKNKKKKV